MSDLQQDNHGETFARLRRAFRVFEERMVTPEAVELLKMQFLQIADLIHENSDAAFRETCAEIVSTSVSKVLAEVESVLPKNPMILEVLEHWRVILTEFERSGFDLPIQVKHCQTDLLAKILSGKTVEEMSESEAMVLLKAIKRKLGIE